MACSSASQTLCNRIWTENLVVIIASVTSLQALKNENSPSLQIILCVSSYYLHSRQEILIICTNMKHEEFWSARPIILDRLNKCYFAEFAFLGNKWPKFWWYLSLLFAAFGRWTHWHIHCPPLTYPLSSCLAEVNPTIAYTFCSVAAQVLAAMAWWWKLESLYTAGTNSALCNNYHFIVCFDLGLSSDSGSGRGLVWKWDGMG